MPSLEEIFGLAAQHHAAGKLQAAENLYRQILDAAPDIAEVHSCLGVVLAQQGKHEPAIVSLRQALRCRPNYPEAHNDLANVLQSVGKLDEAGKHYDNALRLRPDYPEAHNNLGTLLAKQGNLDQAVFHQKAAIRLRPSYAGAHFRLGCTLDQQRQLDEAIACFRQAVGLQPNFADAWNSLGIALEKQGSLDDAVQAFRRALDCRPRYAEAHSNLAGTLNKQGQHALAQEHSRETLRIQPANADGRINLAIALEHSGRLEEAVTHLREVMRLDPQNFAGLTNLGIALMNLDQLDEAAVCHQKVIDLDRNFIRGWINLGSVLERQSRLDEAADCYRRALQLKPDADVAVAYFNLGGVLRNQGSMDESLACFRRALELKPDYAQAHSNLVYGLNFHPGYDAKVIYQEHCLWDRQHAQPLAKWIKAHTNDRTADRRLRIGYVSPDFRDHVVGRNLLPLFREHDHRQFEIVCYANLFKPDWLTERIRGHADMWRDIVNLTDEHVAQLIRDDEIDILVDLSLHMAHNRLLVFARKPAPVQVTFAGYPGTTGLAAIDYRLTDQYLDPPQLLDGNYSEESIRLPDSFWCYDPLSSEPAVNELPAADAGWITFGCLNSFSKICLPVLELWAKVLGAIDRSRLIVLAPDKSQRQLALHALEQHGISADRVAFVGNQAYQQYLETYHRIDIGLDTFPYNGHTTSLDSFWMGVPVITLVGQTVVGRSGILSTHEPGAAGTDCPDARAIQDNCRAACRRSAPAKSPALKPARSDAHPR